MESQQLVDYIRQQLATGYTETNLRPFLARYGWSEQAINEAFATYYTERNSAGIAVSKKKMRTTRTHIKRIKSRSWTPRRWALMGTGVAVLIVSVLGTRFVQNMRNEQPGPAPKVVLTYPQKQSNDVSLVGGAVAQYAATYGDLPTQVQPQADGGLAFCGNTCNVTELTLGSPQVYKSASIKMISYKTDLAAPDKDTMYLVPSAKCKSTTAIGSSTTSPRSIVILYAREDGGSLLQRCVTL